MTSTSIRPDWDALRERLTLAHFEALEREIGGFHIDERDTVDALIVELSAEYGSTCLYHWLEEIIANPIAVKGGCAMSAPSSYRVRFQEWMLWEIHVDEAVSEEDAIRQARQMFFESGSDICRLRDNGSEAWEAEREKRSG